MKHIYLKILKIFRNESILLIEKELTYDYGQFEELNISYFKMREQGILPRIFVSTDIKNNFKNFVILHELGHFLNYKMNILDTENSANLSMLKIIKNNLPYWYRFILMYYLFKYTDINPFKILYIK